MNKSFNPYFNGYYTSTILNPSDKEEEQSFNPYFNGYYTST